MPRQADFCRATHRHAPTGHGHITARMAKKDDLRAAFALTTPRLRHYFEPLHDERRHFGRLYVDRNIA